MEKIIALTVPGLNNSAVEVIAPSGVPSRAVDLNRVGTWIIGVFLVLLIVLSLGYLIFGATMWITSQGDKQKVESARKTITYSIIGMLLALFAITIVTFIGRLINVNLLDIRL